MDRASLIFCVLSLLVCLGLAAVGFPLAAMSPEAMAEYRTPAEAEMLPDLDLGDFGTVPVIDLMTYYIENPPAPPEGGAATREIRFQGC